MAAIGGIPHNLFDSTGERVAIWTAMPDPDIANLGKSRQDGVVWVCGDFAELISTSSTFLSGVEPVKSGESKPKIDPEEAEKRAATRAGKNVRRLVNTNRFHVMWTLTCCPDTSQFAENYGKTIELQNQGDYAYMRNVWKCFLKRLARQYPGIPWLVVFEQHNSEQSSAEKRGTYHIHLVTNTFVEWADMMKLWRHGNVRFDNFNEERHDRGGSVANPGAYVSKYVSKRFAEGTKNKKRYSCSRNIKRPAKIVPASFWALYEGQVKEVFRRERTFEFWNEKAQEGGLYGVSQITYQFLNKENPA